MEPRSDIAALYDRWSETYDSDANRTRDLAGRVLRTELTELARGDVVELGCGTGGNTVWLGERARSVAALDFSQGMLEKARVGTTAGQVRFIQHDIRSELPLDGGSADLVAITLVLEHIEHLEPVFTECARVLRPRGHLFICELHPYRQWAGAQAQFTAATGETCRVPAHVHAVSDYVDAGLAAGLRVAGMGEWRDEADRDRNARPRLLSVLFRRE